MKNVFLVLFFLTFNLGFTQSVNNYKYAIVSSKFSFLKEKDQYKLNTLSKMFMEYYGFETYFDNDILPPDLANQKCKAVFVDVVENNTLFMTKLTVAINDCTNKVLFTSAEGKSREKEYQTAYTQALREAFNSASIIKCKFQPLQNIKENNEFTQTTSEEVLTSKTIQNGFELLDASSNVFLTLMQTSEKNTFIATKNQISGVFFLKNDVWFFEYYKNGNLISETIKVKIQ